MSKITIKAAKTRKKPMVKKSEPGYFTFQLGGHAGSSSSPTKVDMAALDVKMDPNKCPCNACSPAEYRLDSWSGQNVLVGGDPKKPRISPEGSKLIGEVCTRNISTEMYLSDDTQAQVDEALKSYQMRAALKEVGLPPTRKILMTGPPGTGKTMTARVIAKTLGLPLCVVKTEQLVSMWLGQTPKNMETIFKEIKRYPGVYFFDEFDSIGGDRGTGGECTDVYRALNVMLTSLEADESEGCVLFATNFDDKLDKALFRRFDSVIRYGLPDRSIAEKLMRGRLSKADTTGIDWNVAIDAAMGLGHADIIAACNVVLRATVLGGSTTITTLALSNAFTNRDRRGTSARTPRLIPTMPNFEAKARARDDKSLS